MTLFVAPHLQQLDKILMPRVNQIFQFLPDDLVPQRRQDSWTFHNGSTIRLDGVSVGRGVRIRGDAVHLAIIDECRDITDLEQLVSSHIAPMFTTTNGRLIMISTPPESPAHSFHGQIHPRGDRAGRLLQRHLQAEPAADHGAAALSDEGAVSRR